MKGKDSIHIKENIDIFLADNMKYLTAKKLNKSDDEIIKNFSFSDPDMADQAKNILEGSDPDSNLVEGPYISLSRSFAEGEFIEVPIKQGPLHPAIQGIVEYLKMFVHRQRFFEEDCGKSQMKENTFTQESIQLK